MTTASATKPLDLQQVFNWLLADRLIDPKEAKAHYNQARSIQKSSSTTMHPLVAVAQCKLHPANAPQQLMTLDWLSEWLAKKTGLPFLRIDPLKIDFARVADVMSATYASRFNILPVELTATELVIATADPAISEWEAEIAKVTRREIRLVIANPLDKLLTSFLPSGRHAPKHLKASGAE